MIWFAAGIAVGTAITLAQHAARPACVYAMTILEALS